MIEQTIKKLSVGGILIMEYEEISGKGVKYKNMIHMRFKTNIRCGSLVTLGYITLDEMGNLFVDSGYEWNGPNVIRDKKTAMRASLAHDPICELIAAGRLGYEYIVQANDLFKQCCMEDGMQKWEYNLYRWGLRVWW